MKTLTIHHIPGSDNAAPRVRVSYRKTPSAQPQERETELRFDFTDEERWLVQWYLEDYLMNPWGEFPSRAERTEKVISRLGEELFEAVFSDRETQALYANVANDLPNTRIVIHAADPVGISLPWELMRDPAKKEYGDLAPLVNAFARSEPDLFFDLPSPKKKGTFNILMVICRPSGPDLDVPYQSVARPLLELFRDHKDRICLDVLRPPTFEQLSRVLTEKPGFYHVIHFDGHGAFPNATDGARFYGADGEQGQLAFEGEDGQMRLVTGEELGKLIAGKSVPIVLLNACQSGMTKPGSLYASLGNQLLKAGACGVVAMAYSVYVQTAIRFMARLYQGLVNGEELSRAVTYAREELRAHPQRSSPVGDIKLQDWIVPIMFEAAPVQVLVPRKDKVHLALSGPKDSQARAGAEICCPEPPSYGFVGRDGVILRLERAFQTEKVVLLHGMAGIGKTETSMGFARWLAETGGLDGPIFFFSFEHYHPLERVLSGVGEVFNEVIRKSLRTDWSLLDAQQRRQVALDLLLQVPCLMIWDNFEPVHGFPEGTPSAWTSDEQEELRKFLVDLQPGQTRVLITSRREEKWLGKTLRPLELTGLKPWDAHELAHKVLDKEGLDLNKITRLPGYDDLVRYLGGNPLAIQIIMPELKRIQPNALLERLRSGEVTFGAEDPKEGRDKSLTASLMYGLNSLDATLGKRLGIVALFQGFVNAHLPRLMGQEEGAPDLFRGLEINDWKSILDAVAQVGLLRKVGEGLYTVHPALPWFFRDLLDQAFPDHQEWFKRAFTSAYGGYGSLLDAMFRQSSQLAMSLLRAEEDNLMHALRLSRVGECWDDAEGILHGLNQLFDMQGRWVEWERLIEGMEQDVVDTNGEPLPGRGDLFRALLGYRAEILEYQRDFEGAKALHLRLKDHYEGKSDDRNVATCLHQLGIIAQQRRRFDEAESWYGKSLAVKERIGDELGQAQTLHQLGTIASERRQIDEAESWYRKSLVIEERIGNELGQASTLHQLGTIAHERRQFDEAESCSRKSLAIKERIGNEYGQAITMHQLGMIAQGRRQFDEAESWYRKSLAIEERIGNEHGQAITMHQLGGIAQGRRQFDEAESWYRKSLAIKGRIGDEYGQASSLYQLGTIAEERGDIPLAISLYEQAEALVVSLSDPYHLEMVRRSLNRVREK